ncbi:hypothetical protein Tco_0693034 [Tanacetum coccineum]
MSSSTVTYTSISSYYEEPSYIGSPGVMVYEYDELPMHPPSPDYMSRPEHPPSLDYMPGPEHPPSPVYVPYVLEPEYLEYLDHADYPVDGGDGDDEPSDDDDDDDDANKEDKEAFEDEDDDEEEEEHLALADSSAVPVVDFVPSVGDTKAFETDKSAPTPRSPQIIVPPSQTRLRRARKMVRPQTPISFPSEAEVDRLLALPTLPPSPLSQWSSPLPQILSPSLPASSPPLPLPSPLTTSPTDVGTPLGYKAVRIWMRAASPPLLISSTSHRTDIPEGEMSPRKRACFTTPALRFEVRESSAAGVAIQPRPTLEADLRRDRVREIGYGITDT